MTSTLTSLDLLALAAARILGVLGAAPVFGSRILPMRLRAAWALVLGACLASAGGLALGPLGGPGRLSPLLELLPHVAAELLLGVLMGAASLLVLGALRGAAALVSQQSGLSLAAVIQADSGDQGDVLRSLFAAVGLLVFLGAGLDRATVRMVAESFQAVPAGAALGGEAFGWVAAGIVQSAGRFLFEAAALLALPLLALLVALTLLQGLLARAAPELDAVAFGLPLRAAAGLAALALLLPPLARGMGRLLEAAIGEGGLVAERMGG